MADVTEAIDALRTECAERVALAAEATREMVVAGEPSVTGAMREATRVSAVDVADGLFSVEIEVDVDYAAAVDEGTPAYEIVPVTKLDLAWPGGHPVHSVDHPATAGKHFFAEPLPGYWTDALQGVFG